MPDFVALSRAYHGRMDLDALMRGLGPLKQSLNKADAERATKAFEGTSGGGAVKVRLLGSLKIDRVVIAPAAAAAAGGDVSMLEDLVAAAVDDALRQYKTAYGATADEQMQKLMAGQDLMGLMGPLMGGLKR